MCKAKKYKGTSNTKIDECMRNVIKTLYEERVDTLGCCCGHNKYHMTIIINIGFSKLIPLEIFSNVQIERTKKFYKRDKQGYYFIPEVEAYWRKNK